MYILSVFSGFMIYSISSSTIMKKINNLFILLCLAFTCSNSLMAQTATPPSSGDGSSGNPYQIATLDNLYWLSQTTSVWDADIYFIQTANINASATSTWDSGAGFTLIGNGDDSFYGFYDGNEHNISGIYINRPSTEYVGLFGYAEDEEIKKFI
jgi:hypothetical protein